MTDFVFTRYGLHGGDFRMSPPTGHLSGPLIARAIPAPPPSTSWSTATTKPSRACGRSGSKDATVSGAASTRMPSTSISIVDFSNRASPASFARGAAPSFS